jgi:exopolysaccharide production protein ExoQ
LSIQFTKQRMGQDFLLKCSAVAMVILCSQAVFGLLNPQATEKTFDVSPEASPAMAVVSSLVYGLAFIAAIPYWRSLLGILLRAKIILVLPILALLSVAWSQDPALTVRRSIVLMTVTCIGVVFGSLFSLEELSRIVTVASLFICLACFAMGVVSHHTVVDPERPGVWRGIFTQKNVLGNFMILALISSLHSRFQRGKSLRYLTIFSAGLLIVLSHSSTSWVTTAMLLLVLPVWRLARVPAKISVPLLVLVVVSSAGAYALVIGNSGSILSVLGKDSTLSGRTELWALILHAISLRPIWGYGYNAFWLGARGESLTISAAAGWIVPHAHNGFLDILLSVGTVGGGLFLLVLGRCLYLLFVRLRTMGVDMDQLWPASFLLMLILVNLTESILMSANSVFWLLFATLYANLEQEHAQIYRAEYPRNVPNPFPKLLHNSL